MVFSMDPTAANMKNLSKNKKICCHLLLLTENMAEAWKSMYTDPTIRQLENLMGRPPDGEITAELQAKYSTLFTRKVEDVRLAGLNLAAGDLVRDQETQRIANLATPAYWAQCGVHPVDLEDCAPGKHALQRLLYQAVLDFKVKHPKLGVIDTPTVSAYVRAVLGTREARVRNRNPGSQLLCVVNPG